jgi:hypothetical protein
VCAFVLMSTVMGSIAPVFLMSVYACPRVCIFASGVQVYVYLRVYCFNNMRVCVCGSVYLLANLLADVVCSNVPVQLPLVEGQESSHVLECVRVHANVHFLRVWVR